MTPDERKALQQTIGKTISDVEAFGGEGDRTVELTFTDGTHLRLWAWDEYGTGMAGLSVEWLPSEQEMLAEKS